MLEELYNKYRPQNLDELYGNTVTIKALQKAIKNGSHTFLFSGPTGSGKTTTARIVASLVHCTEPHEINAANTRGIDDVRAILDDIQRGAGFLEESRVWIMDEAQQLTTDAANALLKVLEEPPEDLYFIICTTEPSKLLKTIRSRCVEFSFELLKDKDMLALLQDICQLEGYTISVEVLNTIIRIAEGHARKALTLLQAVSGLETQELQEQYLDTCGLGEDDVGFFELTQALYKETLWTTIIAGLNEMKTKNPEGFRKVIMAYGTTMILRGQVMKERHMQLMQYMKNPIYEWSNIVLAIYNWYHAPHINVSRI